jgi:hypothetical protein
VREQQVGEQAIRLVDFIRGGVRVDDVVGPALVDQRIAPDVCGEGMAFSRLLS